MKVQIPVTGYIPDILHGSDKMDLNQSINQSTNQSINQSNQFLLRFFLMHLINKPDTEYTGQVGNHE
jgi:hypothetical protein